MDCNNDTAAIVAALRHEATRYGLLVRDDMPEIQDAALDLVDSAFRALALALEELGYIPDAMRPLLAACGLEVQHA